MLLMDRGSIAELMRVARGGLLGDENPTYGPMNGAMPAPQVPLQNAGMGQPPTAGPIAMAPPSLPAMPQAPQGPGLLSRINDLGRPELPEGMASLLSPAEQRKATGGLLKRIGTQILGLGLFTPEIQAQARAGMMIGAKKAAREYWMEVDAEQQRKAMEEGRKALVASIDWTQPGAGQEYVSGMMRLGANPKDMASAYSDLAPGEQDKPQSLGSGFIWNPSTRKVERLDVPGGVEREVVDGVLYEKVNGRWVPQTSRRPTERPERTPLIHEFDEGGRPVKKISYDNGRSWQMLGNAYKAGAATQQDADLAAREAIRSYNNLLGEPDEKGERHIKDPPSWWNRVMTKSDVTNPLATDDGQAYMNNVRNLVRSWVVTVEGKRMSDADAIANEMLKSFRFGSGKGADEQTKARLEGMADDIRRKIRNDGPSTEGRKTKTITVNGKTFIVPES